MKRFLTCALCFVSLPAIAVTLYYEHSGMCSGLYLSPGCNGTRVTHLNVTPDADTTFTGFMVNGQTIVDANGNVVTNASDILRSAENIGSSISQSYNCKSGFSKNNNGICVDFSGSTQYVEGDSGESTPPQSIVDAPGCFWVYDFDIVFHDRPMSNPPHAVGTFENGLQPVTNPDITVSHKRGDGFYNMNGTKISDITIPLDNNYMFRGYYGKTFNYLDYNTNGGWPIPITDVITDHTTAQGTVWGARFAVPANAKVMNLGVPNLKTSYCDMNWIACKNQGLPNCGDPELPNTVVVDVYGGWARKCVANNGNCGIQIYTTPSGAYTAGDVKYNHTCDTGYTLASSDDSNSYLVLCVQVGYDTINYSFSKFQVFNGTGLEAITCSNVPRNGTCNLGETFTLPDYSPSCGQGNYKFAGWRTNDNIIRGANNVVQCTTTVLGGKDANITGILCDCKGGTYSNVGSQLSAICSEICDASGDRP